MRFRVGTIFEDRGSAIWSIAFGAVESSRLGTIVSSGGYEVTEVGLLSDRSAVSSISNRAGLFARQSCPFSPSEFGVKSIRYRSRFSEPADSAVRDRRSRSSSSCRGWPNARR